MSLSKKRMGEILELIGGQIADYLSVSEIVSALRGGKTWSECLKDRGDELSIFEEIVDINKITDTEFDELIKPHLARRLAEDLGAKKVTIKW